MNKKIESTTTETVPFFARKVDDAPLAVRTGVRAGAQEPRIKAKESDIK